MFIMWSSLKENTYVGYDATQLSSEWNPTTALRLFLWLTYLPLPTYLPSQDPPNLVTEPHVQHINASELNV